MQTAQEKAAAIASVLWLLPDHYTMIHIGRSGVTFTNELQEADPAKWQERIPHQFQGWPIEELERWFAYQRYLSRRYRLWSVGLALQKLEKAQREQAMAVKVACIDPEALAWYEPARCEERCQAGLAFMAEDVPGDVPFFQETARDPGAKKRALGRVARNRRIMEMTGDGVGKKKIARELGCSLSTIAAVTRGLAVRRGRTVDAASVDK
jgi:hypothetical protein